MKVLNVAEKPSVAKSIMEVLTGGQCSRLQTFSPYNQVFSFNYNSPAHGPVEMLVTSVAGHLMSTEFDENYTNWNTTPPIELFTAPVNKYIPPDKAGIAQTLRHHARGCDELWLWLDCDREGENIAFEVSDVCLQANRRLRVRRAVFSALTHQQVTHAIRNLQEPKKNDAEAVDARQTLDLRIGAAYTRFQTRLLQKTVDTGLISYGPCQFPALGFVVRRYQRHRTFTRQRFWSIVLTYTTGQGSEEDAAKEEEEGVGGRQAVQMDDSDNVGMGAGARGRSASRRARGTTGTGTGSGRGTGSSLGATTSAPSISLTWERGRVYDEYAALILAEECLDAGEAEVVACTTNPTSKWRPKPLSTVVFQKNMSRFYKMSSQRAMEVAEGLYQRGILSYPRTETDSFSKDIPLLDYVTTLMGDCTRAHTDTCTGTSENPWGYFAYSLVNGGFKWPSDGGNDDKAHPPIHPLKLLSRSQLTDEEWKVYEYVVRHFLACCSEDARAEKTALRVRLGNEFFRAQGLMVTARNYLAIYPWEKWSDKDIPVLRAGMRFIPTRLWLSESLTSPPSLLSEHDLLGLMHKHGIGTDATMAQHIDTIRKREYVASTAGGQFHPTPLGLALVQGYDAMGVMLAEPGERAKLEADVVRVSVGAITKEEVIRLHSEAAKATFRRVMSQAGRLVAQCAALVPASIDLYSVGQGGVSVCGVCGLRGMDMLVRGAMGGAGAAHTSTSSNNNTSGQSSSGGGSGGGGRANPATNTATDADARRALRCRVCDSQIQLRDISGNFVTYHNSQNSQSGDVFGEADQADADAEDEDEEISGSGSRNGGNFEANVCRNIESGGQLGSLIIAPAPPVLQLPKGEIVPVYMKNPNFGQGFIPSGKMMLSETQMNRYGSQATLWGKLAQQQRLYWGFDVFAIRRYAVRSGNSGISAVPAPVSATASVAAPPPSEETLRKIASALDHVYPTHPHYAALQLCLWEYIPWLCANCGYQAMQCATKTSSKPHYFCPYCFCFPPQQAQHTQPASIGVDDVNAGGSGGGALGQLGNAVDSNANTVPDVEEAVSMEAISSLRCFRCPNTACALAAGPDVTQPLFPCPLCNSGGGGAGSGTRFNTTAPPSAPATPQEWLCVAPSTRTTINTDSVLKTAYRYWAMSLEDVLAHHDTVWREGERGQTNGHGVVVSAMLDEDVDNRGELSSGLRQGTYTWRNGACDIPRRLTWVTSTNTSSGGSGSRISAAAPPVAGIIGYYNTAVVTPGMSAPATPPPPRGMRRVVKSTVTSTYLSRLSSQGNVTSNLRGKTAVAVMVGGVGRSQVKLACAHAGAAAADSHMPVMASDTSSMGKEGCRAVVYLPSWVNKIEKTTQKCGKCSQIAKTSWLARVFTCSDFDNTLNDAGGVHILCLRPGCDPRMRIEVRGGSGSAGAYGSGAGTGAAGRTGDSSGGSARGSSGYNSSSASSASNSYSSNSYSNSGGGGRGGSSGTGYVGRGGGRGGGGGSRATSGSARGRR